MEDAYRDFIETDLMIGMGRVPVQFVEGVTLFKEIYSISENIENISLTGHSLGGGICQYVAITSDRIDLGIPYVCTWNAIGINKSGIVSIDDFIDIKKVLNSDKNLKNKIISEFKDVEELQSFEKVYKNFLYKELKKMNILKDSETIILDEEKKICWNLTEEIMEDLKKNIESIKNRKKEENSSFFRKENFNTNFLYKNMMLRKKMLSKEILKKEILSKKIVEIEVIQEKAKEEETKAEKTLQNQIVKYKIEDSTLRQLFDNDELNKSIRKAKIFLEKFRENTIYEEKIVNFVHTKDMTISLFQHVGSVFSIDNKLEKYYKNNNKFMRNFMMFTKHIKNYHLHDIFLPYLVSFRRERGKV